MDAETTCFPIFSPQFNQRRNVEIMVNYFPLNCSSESCRNQEFAAIDINLENYDPSTRLKYFIKYSLKIGALAFLGIFAFFVSGVDTDDDIIFGKEDSNYTATILKVYRDRINLRKSTKEIKLPCTKCALPPIFEVTYFESDVLEYPTGPSPPVFMLAA